MANGQNGLAAQRELKRSVKQGDDGRVVQFVVNYDTWRYKALPQQLPVDYGGWYGFNRPKDAVLLSTPHHAAMWASALGIAIKKRVSLAWEVSGEVAIRYRRAQQWLLNAGAGMGLFGWVPFLSMGLRSYYCTGVQYIEIERATSANGSRVINVHHLDPLKCCLTGDNETPVHYLADDGKVRPLKWHEVIIISSLPDPTEGRMGIMMSAAEQAYKRIILDAALERYVYERITGLSPNSIHFIGNALERHIEDAVRVAKDEASAQGLTAYMNAIMVPVPSDTPIGIASIDLASIPEKTDPDRERSRSDLIYAHVLDLDPQEVNPQLVGRQGLGSSGNQSVVLAQKGRGYRSWEQQFTHQLNQLALDSKTTFTFVEDDVRDRQANADVRKTDAETEKILVETGITTPSQSLNNMVDGGYLPSEYLQAEDATASGSLADTEKPDENLDVTAKSVFDMTFDEAVQAGAFADG